MECRPVVVVAFSYRDIQKRKEGNSHSLEGSIQSMNIYVAGPMRGIPHFNFPAFAKASEKLRSEGHIVFNPAERDNERHGTNIGAGNETGCEKKAAQDYGFNLREALGDDLAWICANADAIALLPGWERSRGARAEHATAAALGLRIIILEA